MRRIQNKRLVDRLELWLEAEVNGEDDKAELELRRVFRVHALPGPERDLVEATMTRLGLSRVESTAVVPRLAYRVLAGAALGAAGLALATIPRFILPWLSSMRISWVIDWWTAVIVGLSQRFAGGLAFWMVLRDVAETVAMALASPTSLAVLVTAVLLSFLSFRALSGLVTFERSAGNV